MEFTGNEEKIVTKKGTIKLFKKDKGYGFITDNMGRDIFFHISSLKGKKEAETNEEVSFVQKTGPIGPIAIWVSFDKTIYRVLYKRYVDDKNFIIFSTGTVDEIIYPANPKQVRFQKKIESGWLECSDPRLRDEPA